MSNIIKVGGGGGGSSVIVSKTITQNGTYNASADSADGYNPVVVNVSGGGIEPSPSLPVEYQKYDFLDIQGGYFETVIPTTALWNVVFSTSKSSTNKAQGVFGYRLSSSSSSDWYFSINPDLTTGKVWARGALTACDVKPITNLSTNTKYSAWFSTNADRTGAYIGLYYKNGSSTQYDKYEFYGKLYRLVGYEMEQNNGYIMTPICDFVPCYRISDNTVGLYEVISGTFLTPTLLSITGVGTGTVTGGNE